MAQNLAPAEKDSTDISAAFCISGVFLANIAQNQKINLIIFIHKSLKVPFQIRPQIKPFLNAEPIIRQVVGS